MLKPGGGRPEACIRASSVGPNVQRAGTKITMSFLGGTPSAATSYDLQLENTEQRRNHGGRDIGIPRDRSPVERSIAISFPKQGQFLLVGKSGDRRLRPADLKAGGS